jgi:hypothetical protein
MKCVRFRKLGSLTLRRDNHRRAGALDGAGTPKPLNLPVA